MRHRVKLTLYPGLPVLFFNKSVFSLIKNRPTCRITSEKFGGINRLFKCYFNLFMQRLVWWHCKLHRLSAAQTATAKKNTGPYLHFWIHVYTEEIVAYVVFIKSMFTASMLLTLLLGWIYKAWTLKNHVTVSARIHLFSENADACAFMFLTNIDISFGAQCVALIKLNQTEMCQKGKRTLFKSKKDWA